MLDAPPVLTLTLARTLCMSLVVLAALALPGYAAASGTGGSLTFTPPSGPVGTRVTVTIFVAPASPTPYLLSASATDPAQDNCSDGVQLPDAPRIVVPPAQPTTATFTWPGGMFSSGAYYLCASPAGGQAGSTVWSGLPFSVADAAALGPTPAPSDSGVVANVPRDGVSAGGSFMLIVDTSVTLGGNAPTVIVLLDLENLSAVPVQWDQTAHDGAVYTYDLTVSGDTAPGTYAVRVTTAGGGFVATSDPFLVTDGPVPPPLSILGISANSQTNPLLIAAIALLLALAVASLAGPLLRRRGNQPPR